ncbi:MAG: insulinase family protein [Bacillota bacterium]|nr:insulinase family protein [Bacillota bacterium]MDW7676975.1 insulinase family protein [Bacillota bacterium]
MGIVLNDLVHGFRVKRIQQIEEVKGTGYEMVHEKSGAKLYYLQAEDDNKVFSVTFRTPPSDSTGLPHILEHSVLCGSKKYPLKDPFVELAKGSMNTFLNAMTFSDKTMYPVASRNDQDFLNLMDVYLNAVFYPNLYQQPEILQQEGWHYELKHPEDPLHIKGVVYNEMKGAFSSPEQILFRKIQESLFPDTPYGYESGGDPDHIPELTQKMFTDFHQTFYHPSNSYLYLYGDGDIEKHLSFINDEYLSHFQKTAVDSSIPLQPPFETPGELSISYPLGSEEEISDKAFLSLNFVTGDASDPEKQLGMEMLNYLLLGTPAAPLKRTLLKAEVGKDVFGSYDSSIRQPVFSIVVKNSDEEKKVLFQQLVQSTLQDLVNNGIDKVLVESVINIHEFKLREADYGRYPQGLIFGMKLMESWLYDADPALHLQYEKSLKKIKSALTQPYFEELIDDMLLKNPHHNLLIITPEKGLNEKKEALLREQLAQRKASMSNQDIATLIAQNEQLAHWQNQPHSEEELSVIPLLSLEDLDAEPEKIPSEADNFQEIEILKHSLFTNRIQYVNLYFNLCSLTSNEIPYVGLLTKMLGRISTCSYDYEALSNELNLHTGGIHARTDVFPVFSQPDTSTYRLTIRGKALASKNTAFWHLMREILLETLWDDLPRIREVIRETKSRLEMSLHQEGHIVAARRTLASFSTEAAFGEAAGGISFYHFVSDLDRHFDNRIESAISIMRSILRRSLVRQNCLVSYTGEEQDYPAFRSGLMTLMEQLPDKSVDSNEAVLSPMEQGNEGLILSGKVQYVAKASNFIRHGYAYSGTMQVLRTLCSLDYLWKRIRVTGGAYGSMAGLFRNGNAYFVSYRDPNLEETLKVYDEMADYIESFQVNEREITKYIIGTMSRVDAPLTPSMKGEKADAHYLSGITYEDELKERKEIIETTAEEIRPYGNMVRRLMADNIYCVIGNESKIQDAGHLFDHILHVNR